MTITPINSQQLANANHTWLRQTHNDTSPLLIDHFARDVNNTGPETLPIQPTECFRIKMLNDYLDICIKNTQTHDIK